MSCNLSAGRNEVCKESIGGLSGVYFVNFTGSLANITDGDSDALISTLPAGLTA